MLQSYVERLDALKENARYRALPLPPDGVDFSGNDFLGLAAHPLLAEASANAAQQFGTGATGSRLISGTSQAVLDLEKAIADWKGTESALVLNSGYQGNIAILQGLLSREDWVFWDRLNHASLVDGVMLCGARWKRYRHLDLDHLESLLREASNKKQDGNGKKWGECNKWIVTDTLFSMDGDYPDLAKLCDIAEKYGAMVMVDEAHASGVFGESKRSGLCEALGVGHRVTLQAGTFSKALGGFGAYVAGPDILMQTLVNNARGFIYSTALPPSVIAANAQALSLIRQESGLCDALWENVRFCWELLARELPESALFPAAFAGGKIQQRQTQIIPIYVPGNERVLAMSERLASQGYIVRAIRQPTVAKGQERLRVALSARHTRAEIQGLVGALKAAFSAETEIS